MNDLARSACIKSVIVMAVMAALLFVSAGTWRYWQAWLYLLVFAGASALLSADLISRDPALLRRRLSGGPWAETEPSQRIIMTFAVAGFLALLAISALDRRFGWSAPPAAASLAADLVFLAGFYVVFLVFRENSFTAATIAVEATQRVVTSGPYRLVRHPMYSGALLYSAATPVALGSYWGLLGFFVLASAVVWRLFDEERFLKQHLPGYAEYCARLRWRLIPGVF